MTSNVPPIIVRSDTIRTSFLLSNIHCPTCVTTIQDVLRESHAHHIRWVSPNVVTSVVTVEHSPLVTVIEMESTLEEAGFDLCAVTTSADGSGADPLAYSAEGASGEGSGQKISRPVSALAQWMASSKAANKTPMVQGQRAKVHLQNCEKCRTANPQSSDDKPFLLFTPPQPSTSTALDKTAMPQQSTRVPGSSFITVESIEVPSQARRRAIVAIGGMTCAVCVNTITDELSKRDWISKAVVSLVTNSATVEFDDDGKVGELIEAIEDLGYEATLDTLLHLDKEKPITQERVVEILLDGIYCEHCPDRVARSLAGFRRQLEIVGEPTEKRPIMKVSYAPEAPSFTVRQILAAIEAGDPALSASIYHPPTIEERSKQILRHHQLQLLHRIILTGIICIPTFIIGVVFLSLVSDSNAAKRYLTAPWTSGISRAQISLFVMATPVYVFAADLFHTRALKEIRALWRRGSRTPVLHRFYRFGSMNTLISLGTTIAYVSSVAQLIAAGVNHSHNTDNSDFYFDSVVFLTFFLLIGRLIESVSKSRAGDAVEMLGRLRPRSAILVEHSGTEKEQNSVVPIDLLDFGDVLRVPHGVSPPADGIIVQGETIFEESSLTGESRPVKKKIGDQVFSGTVNKGAPVLIKVTGVAGTSMLDQIINVIREGQTMRAPMEQIADVMTSYFVPVITLIAVLTWLIWMSLGLSGSLPLEWLDVSSGGWVAWSLQFATAVFIVACPCGLALAAPTAIFVGGGLAAKHGILAKGGGEAFEKAGKIDCVVFDKTGTLTQGGEPTIIDFMLYPESDDIDEARKATLLAALKAVEEVSSHPIAKAIVTFCTSPTSEIVNVDNLEEIPGKGMKATYKENALDCSFELVIGNEALMDEFSVHISPTMTTLLQRWKTEAKSIALAGTRPISTSPSAAVPAYNLVAAFSISDPIRPEASSIIQALHTRGTDVWLLSGDNPTTAAAVASQLGIKADNVIAGVLPTQKAEKIKYLQSILKARTGSNTESTARRAAVAMVGDGINDAPALTTADVGIAIGSGSDIAINSADFVLLNSDLHNVITLLDLSQTVFRRIKFNFGWALVYNCIAVPVAAGCFYPIVSGGRHVHLDPVWASLAMALSSISVVTSSLSLRSRIPWIGFRAGSPAGKNASSLMP
ncbi:uncharacterized protein Z518_00302 [Rhinocladiella mackenziei CBS 650.93]|uniref:HMA domain-containing protein n=1 Tax=Rhinocladiella mackenziei CBS 650.93 TaxID=1442369 RepID=A0A0D2HEW6_9EURO|nr:uncharacterized protein Z518_00302 [Rhinocladiella mackenziei CBS 650.93]KIX09223.1 hypothetical protein Z518_00302 [Rhinocladiella mackenziei CBS 650.93]